MKRVGLVLVGLSLVSLVFGQSELVTVSVGGGLHSLKHEPKLPSKNELGNCFGEGKLSAGATFSARYMHFFRDGNWGIGTGADVSYYAATSCLDGEETTSEYDISPAYATEFITSTNRNVSNLFVIQQILTL